MPTYDRMVQRQKVLADFGEFALACDDLDWILTEACRLVAAALGTRRAKVLEIQDGGQRFLVRAGVGWPSDVVGHFYLPMGGRSSELYSIKAGRPVITGDISKEDRFEAADLMRRAGVVAFVNAPIRLPGNRTYGLIQVDDTEPRDFGEGDAEFLRTYTAILGPVIDRLLRLGDVHRTEERFRLTAAEILDHAIFVTDRDDRITDWLPGAAAVFGWSAAEAVGRHAAMLFTPEDQGADEPGEELRQARDGGVAPNVRWHVRKGGSRVFMEGSVRALRDAEGALTGFLKIGQDVTERRADEARLRESEDWLRTLMEGAPQLNWRSGPEGRWTWASPQWLDYTGQSQEQTHGLGWLDAIHPEDRDGTMQAWHEAASRGRLDVQHRIGRAIDGAWRWHQTRSLPMRHAPSPGPDRAAPDWLGTSTDIDELKCLQSEQKVLVAELQHRTRNLLAVVRSLARKSVPPSPGRDEYDARLAAVGRVQGFLSRSTLYTVPLADVVEAELQAAGDGASGKVVVDGPPVDLPGESVQAVALALHELATNAVKYGAMAQAAGRLAVRWRIEAGNGGDSPRLVIDWRESGVAMPDGPPARRGYGSELITRALPYQLGAETALEFAPDGVRCRITLPASAFGSTKEEPA